MSINTPTGWDEELKSRLKGLTDEQKDELLEILKKDKLEREKSAWNEEAILEDLKENHVKIEENKEMLGHKWKIIHIDLPAVWEFGWFKFDCFVEYLNTWEKEFDFDGNEEYENKSYTEEEITKLLEAIAGYMKEYWVYMDEDIWYRYEVWKYLKEIAWLSDLLYDKRFWLKDKESKNERVYLDFERDGCGFSSFFPYQKGRAKLLLKLSD